MEIDPPIRTEWSEHHALGRVALAWLHAHADPGDTHPIITAIAQLRSDVASGDALRR